MKKTLRIATRKSKLALTQTRWFADRLKEHNPGLVVDEVHVVTKGDKVTDKPLAAIGGKGLFITEVEAAVFRGEADIAVHSLKDVPGDRELAEGMGLVCLPPRVDPRDVLLTRDGIELMELSAGAKVGTTSLRRVAQLSAHRPDLNYETLRGNVDTRLARLDAGDFDAIILAAAGLSRLGLLASRAHQVLSTEVCLPAVGQGTLAIEARLDDDATLALLAPLDDEETRRATEAERAMLKRLEGSCRSPIAGYAREHNGRFSLTGLVSDVGGLRVLTATSEEYVRPGEVDSVSLGEKVADSLIAAGARELMREAEADVIRREKKGNGHSGHGGYGWR